MPRGVGGLSRPPAAARAGRPLAVVPRVAERLAALLDGRLDAARRAATLDRLSRVDAARETLADAAAAARALERPPERSPARALRPAPSPARPPGGVPNEPR